MSVVRRMAGPVLVAGLTTFAACSTNDSSSTSTEAPETAPSTTTETVRVLDRAGTPVRADLGREAVEFVRAKVSAGENDTWKVRKVERGADKLQHVRMDQLYKGVRVWNADVVVHA